MYLFLYSILKICEKPIVGTRSGRIGFPSVSIFPKISGFSESVGVPENFEDSFRDLF